MSLLVDLNILQVTPLHELKTPKEHYKSFEHDMKHFFERNPIGIIQDTDMVHS